MKTDDLLHEFDNAAVADAIAAAERRTTGEIRVYVSRKKPDDAVVRATRRFNKLGMDKTRDRNAVLIYFAPEAQKFAVIGDVGIHRICGQEFWEEVAADISARLRQEKFQEAVVGAVKKVGDVLARHFPDDGSSKNELPDTVITD